ncbi:unnamed protein product [Caenorhabditis brenneri]
MSAPSFHVESASEANQPATMSQLFSKTFIKVENTSSQCYMKNVSLEVEVAQLRALLNSEKEKNASLTIENEKLQKDLEESQKLKTENEKLHSQLEKLKLQNRAQVKELSLDKEELIRKLQSAYQEVTDLIHVEVNLGKLRNVVKTEEQILKDQKAIEELRKKTQSVMLKKLNAETTKNGALFDWQACEICLEPFGQEEERTPRILGCGHTFCLGCSKQFIEEDYVKCPFDRTCTLIGGAIEKALPKNFTVLNMCAL